MLRQAAPFTTILGHIQQGIEQLQIGYAHIEQRGPIGTRVLHGLLAMAGKHPVAALEAATEKALHHGTWRLRDLRLLLERAGPVPQLDFLETHPLIRSLDAYEALTPDCFNPQPKTVYEHT